MKWNDAWWEEAFNSAVKSVPSSALDASTSSSSEDDSDEDEERKVGEKVKRMHRDGTISSASAEELKLLEHLSKSDGKVAAGRFGGRDGKMARIRAQEELEAREAAKKLGTGRMADVSSSDDSESTQSPPEVTASVPNRRSDGKKRKRIVIDCIDPRDTDKIDSFSSFSPTPKTGWWGSAVFVSAGSLVGAAMEVQPKAGGESENNKGFSEDLQANIFNSAHLGKTTGKIGLGKGKRGTIKVGGTAWKGTKVIFEDGCDNDIADPGDKDAIRRRKQKINWKKIIAKIVKKEQKGSKGIKMKSLRASVKKVVEQEASCPSKSEIKQGIKRAVSESKKFCIKGKYIALKT